MFEKQNTGLQFPQPKRFNALDSLRGIAALLLVIYHVQGIPKLEITGWVAYFVKFFGAGVPLFYALSAFSLMIGYRDRLNSSGGLAHFYIRRVFRILPLFYALLIFWLLIREFYFNAQTSFPLLVLNYFCVFGLIPVQHEGIVWASWSIGVEMLFYMVFPLLLVASRTLLSSLLVFLATLAISVASQEFLGSFKDKAPSFAYMAISTQIVFFGAGLFAYRLGEFFAAKIAIFSEKRRHYIAEAIFLGGIALLLLYWLTPMASWAGKFHLGSQVLAFAWIFMLAPVLVHGQLKTLAIRPLERAGKISFSLYLLNPPVIFFLSQAGFYKFVYSTFPMPNVAFGICLLLTLCVLWILSELTYHLIEEKGILLGNNLLSESKAQASSATPQPRPALHSRNTKIIIFLAALPWLVWWGLAMVPPAGQVKPASGQSIKPQVDEPSTKKLWESLSPQDTLTVDDNLKLLENGIRIHPGGNPKTARFLLKKKFGKVDLVAFIHEMPKSALKDPLAAKAAVEIFLDGKTQGRRLVDSNSNQTFALDLSQINELRVIVDCANKTAKWDWVNIGIKK